jgi:class 3 adenylate cyclase
MSEGDQDRGRARETMRRLQHEVRTPISQIIGYAELLEEELEDAGQAELVGDLHKIRAAAQRLLDLADGRLRDEQDPGAPVLPDAEEASAGESAPTPGEGSDHRTRVLVVDGDDGARELLIRRLERNGFEVTSARDGIEGLRKIEAEGPDLVLLEVLLPGMGGLEVLERARRTSSPAELPIILVTALGDSSDVVEGLERGANDYVTKPLDLPVVIARVRSQVEAHRMARQVSELARQLEFRSTFIRQALGRDVSGELLVEMAERPDALALGRERRRVFAVVADVKGSRERGASLPPEQHAAALKNVFDGLVERVEHHDGLVDAVSGDSLVALFGLPLPRDDDAERASACAIAMQLEMEEINQKNRGAKLPELEIGVGVAAGEVLMVGLGSDDRVRFRAVGDPPLDAARVESAAQAGEVWICSSTREALGETAHADREQDLAAEGKARALHIHRLLGLGGVRLISLRSLPGE